MITVQSPDANASVLQKHEGNVPAVSDPAQNFQNLQAQTAQGRPARASWKRPRILLAAPGSGSGKTLLTTGLLTLFQNRGIRCRSFKCGPDYIDPMFHRRVLGVPSRNLDLYLQGEAGVKRTMEKQSAQLAILEGAMGFYDGLGGTTEASAWRWRIRLHIPAVLVVRPGGSSITLAAQIRGLMGPGVQAILQASY